MKIDIPSEEEYSRSKRKRLLQGFFGFLAGLIIIGLAGSRIFRYGFNEVEWYTWVALFTVVFSFTFLAYKFGDSFWVALTGK